MFWQKVLYSLIIQGTFPLQTRRQCPSSYRNLLRQHPPLPRTVTWHFWRTREISPGWLWLVFYWLDWCCSGCIWRCGLEASHVNPGRSSPMPGKRIFSEKNFAVFFLDLNLFIQFLRLKKALLSTFFPAHLSVDLSLLSLFSLSLILHIVIFFSRTTGPISTKLGTKHPSVNGIQVYKNDHVFFRNLAELL